MVLWSAKVPKAQCQSGKGPFTPAHTHQKNSGTLFLFATAKLKMLHTPTQKPLRLRFGSAICKILQLFF